MKNFMKSNFMKGNFIFNGAFLKIGTMIRENFRKRQIKEFKGMTLGELESIKLKDLAREKLEEKEREVI